MTEKRAGFVFNNYVDKHVEGLQEGFNLTAAMETRVTNHVVLQFTALLANVWLLMVDLERL